ncbi:MAG: DUF4169 domain-containing protein [Mesorhizobium amorphae]|nr:MAG: DUF4169 domain-containing protein [Mesorhizobium amorphae]
MTGEIVNLRSRRKARDRAEREKTAEANRILHGRTKAEKFSVRREKDAAERLLDGHRLDAPKDGETP